MVPFVHSKYDHFGVGVFKLLDAPAASFSVQTYQCPTTAWIPGASANVAVVAQVGNVRFVGIGNTLQWFTPEGDMLLGVVGEDVAETWEPVSTSTDNVQVHCLSHAWQKSCMEHSFSSLEIEITSAKSHNSP